MLQRLKRNVKHGRRQQREGEDNEMAVWIVIVSICLILLAAEAVFILSDKMPWKRRNRK